MARSVREIAAPLRDAHALARSGVLHGPRPAVSLGVGQPTLLPEMLRAHEHAVEIEHDTRSSVAHEAISVRSSPVTGVSAGWSRWNSGYSRSRAWVRTGSGRTTRSTRTSRSTRSTRSHQPRPVNAIAATPRAAASWGA